MLKNLSDTLSPALKYWIFITGIIAVIFTVLIGSFAASYFNLLPEEQAVFDKLFNKLIPFPFVGAIILVAFICTMVSLLFRYYIIPVLRMAEQTRLITAANPDFRISPQGAKELTALAKVINESADAFQKLRDDVDRKIHESGKELKEERNRFAALMSELPYGVVVCNRDGAVLLYNRLAQEMLAVTGEGTDSGPALGLGRSVFSLLERDPLVHALEVMNHAFDSDQVKPALGLMTKLVGSRFIRVNMAPVITGEDDSRQLTGFVLSLENISGEVDTVNERDRLLQDMIDAIQESLGKLHKGLNAICDTPGEKQTYCTQHRQAITDVADDLEQHLSIARKLYTEHQHAYGNRENVQAEAILKLISKNISERFSILVETSANATAWVKIDSYAIVQMMSNLAGVLKNEYDIQKITCTVDELEHVFKLSVMWPEQVIPELTIKDWLKAPLFAISEGKADSPDVIINMHKGELTLLESEASTCKGVLLELPVALEDEPADIQSTIVPRPVSYEFDLFHQPGQEALGDVALRKLTYVAFDTETTGLNPSEGDEIIQLGAVRVINGRLLYNECIDQLVNPQRHVPESSVEIHGIDPALLTSQPVITKVLTGFHAFAADSVLVAHNAAFDMRFLQLKEEATGLSFDNPVLDTLLLSSIVHPNQEGHSLDAIAERFNITIVGRHTALGDALVTAKVLLKLIPLLEAQGIHTLQEALDASLKSQFAKIKY